MSTQLRVKYSFQNYVVNGIGADLVRLTGIKNICESNNIQLYLAKYDNWSHVPSNVALRNWEYYFEASMPIDVSNEFPEVSSEYVGQYNKTIVPNSLGKFEYRSSLMKELYRPKQQFMDLILKYIEENLDFLVTDNYIAVHIRRGDKTSGPWREGTAIAVVKYLDAVRQYVASNNIKEIVVFIATDTEAVINEVKEFADEYQKYGMILKWDQKEKRRDGYCYHLYCHGYNDSDKVDEIITFMKNMYIMENAKKLVGSRMSFFFITAELLRGKQEISLSDNTMYPVDFYDEN